MEETYLSYARYGEADLLKALADDNIGRSESLANYVQQDTENTPLHMACANGHIDCVRELLLRGARHCPNASGNYPLHWAVQNKHLEVVKILLSHFDDIDVLAQNSFGRGCVTEAFQSEDTEILAALLEHKSASEERLAAGSGMDNTSIREEDAEDDEISETSDSKPRILQEKVLEFSFQENLPILKARELALDLDTKAFGTTAEEDITGVSIWSASLILTRWVIDQAQLFDGKTVCELGSGCGVSGLACHMYTKASHVLLSDLYEHTLSNLEYNVNLNKKETERQQMEEKNEEVIGCAHCGVLQKFSVDNPEGKLMQCGGCRSVEYCSRECQKKSWKQHKVQCKLIRTHMEAGKESLNTNETTSRIEVAPIDWAKRETWPKQKKFDILLGSDIVYHKDIVPILADTVDGLLTSNGQFLHVASDQRDALPEFKDAMEAKGFTCEAHIVPDVYKRNPLVGQSAELFDLHFNEMEDTYCMYTFTRTDSFSNVP